MFRKFKIFLLFLVFRGFKINYLGLYSAYFRFCLSSVPCPPKDPPKINFQIVRKNKLLDLKNRIFFQKIKGQ